MPKNRKIAHVKTVDVKKLGKKRHMTTAPPKKTGKKYT